MERYDYFCWDCHRKPAFGLPPPPIAPKPKLNRKTNEDAVAEEHPSSFADVSVLDPH